MLVFLRLPEARQKNAVLFVGNFTPVTRRFRLGLPWPGSWEVVLNSDDPRFGGSGVGPLQGEVTAEIVPHVGRGWSVEIDLPPLAMVLLRSPVPEKYGTADEAEEGPGPEA